MGVLYNRKEALLTVAIEAIDRLSSHSGTIGMVIQRSTHWGTKWPAKTKQLQGCKGQGNPQWQSRGGRSHVT
jgi:hypothetical protein